MCGAQGAGRLWVAPFVLEHWSADAIHPLGQFLVLVGCCHGFAAGPVADSSWLRPHSLPSLPPGLCSLGHPELSPGQGDSPRLQGAALREGTRVGSLGS